MAKRVVLTTGREFKTIGAAKAHFAEVLEKPELKTPFEGEELADIRAAYLAYCEATEWPLPSLPASFYPMHERGPGYTTRCFGVTFEDGRSESFSMPKALSAIAV